MNSHYYALLLSGGSGTRFWPQSRFLSPKQFLPLVDNKTLFEITVSRIRPFIPGRNIFVATHLSQRSLVHKHIKKYRIPFSNVIAETQSKSTAPSISAAVSIIHRKDPLARICVLPCDHFIKNNAAFRRILLRAFALCDTSLIVFGVPPERPCSGYGYIKARPDPSGKNYYPVQRFIEKPGFKTAKKFCKDKRYFWNSGMCAGSSRQFLQAIQKTQPAYFNRLQKIRTKQDLASFWKSCKPISFDYAVLEKTSGLHMLVASGLGWSDVGSWFSYDEQLLKDRDGNVFKGNTVQRDCRNTTVLGKSRLIACIGLNDTIVIDTDDAVLICKKSKAEEVKQIVTIIKKRFRRLT